MATTAVQLKGYKRITPTNITAQKISFIKVVCPLTMLRTNGRSAAANKFMPLHKKCQNDSQNFKFYYGYLVNERANCT